MIFIKTVQKFPNVTFIFTHMDVNVHYLMDASQSHCSSAELIASHL